LGFLEKSKEFIRAEREWLAKELKRLGLKVYGSCGSFLLCQSERPLGQTLLDRGIMVRDCGSFLGLDSRYIRIGAKRRADNESLVKAINALL
jgi:threonine-phosphate decarboxylase